jgi:polyhydroxyalkanoate synthesis regulator phasin
VIEHCRRARHIAFSVPEGVTQIAGANESGKTSAMEAIMRIIHGLRGFAPFRKPELTWNELRGGAKLDLGELEAELILTEGKDDGGKVKVTRKDGTALKADVLHELFGEFSRDPVELARAKEDEVVRVLQQIAGAEHCERAQALEAAYAEAYAARRMAKQEADRFGGQADPGAEPVAVAVDEVMAALKLAQEHNESQARKARAIERAGDEVKAARANADRAARRVTELEAALVEARAEVDRLCATHNTLIASEQALPQPEALQDTTALQQKIAAAGAANKARETWREARTRFERWMESIAKVTEFERKVATLEDEREKHARTVKLPVPGIAWSKGTVTIDGRPWRDESTSKLMRICTRLVLAAQVAEGKPALLFVHRGESCDQKSFNEICAEVAKVPGARLIFEKVGKEHEGGAAVIRVDDGVGYGEGEQVF